MHHNIARITLAGKVLLVDDMRLNRIVLRRMLQKLGFEVVEADNGLAAIEQFLCHRAALSCVLLDLQMPQLDGWETAKQLRMLEAGSCWGRVPIVGCTALGLQENWHGYNTVTDSALSCGFDGLLEKMPTMSKLLEVLTKHVTGLHDMQQQQQALSTQLPKLIMAPCSLGVAAEVTADGSATTPPAAACVPGSAVCSSTA